MDRNAVAQAVYTLQQRGVPLDAITVPQVREVLGSGSHREIAKHLDALRRDPEVQLIGDWLRWEEALQTPAIENPQEGNPGPSDEAPTEPMAEAEQALAHAQGQVMEAEAQLSTREDAVQEARGEVLAAMGDVLAAAAAMQRGFLPRDDPASALAEDRAKGAARTYQDARGALDQAQQRHTRAQQHQEQAQQRLALAQRDAYVRREAPDLWARTQAALTDFMMDPTLQNPLAHAASDVQRARWTHDHRLSRLEAELAALLDQAEAQGLVPPDPRPVPQRKLVARSRTWL